MNIINAIINLINAASVNITTVTEGNNRVNNMGEGLENYVRDLFADSFSEVNPNNKKVKLNHAFSFLGSKNFSPDGMLRCGDAIEIKKIESKTSDIALNSSYPKQKLKRSDHRVAKACKNARGDSDWIERDIIYVVGYVPKNTNTLKVLGMVYGTEYCAASDLYESIFNTVKDKIAEIPEFEFTDSEELAHMKGIDPLERTYWRARAMWGIKNPWRAFNDVYHYDDSKEFSFMCIINNEKWSSFTNTEELIELSQSDDRLTISDIQVPNPDNAADLIDAKLISFSY